MRGWMIKDALEEETGMKRLREAREEQVNVVW
jgi:hypothetical protein